jgi:hypothetical protein
MKISSAKVFCFFKVVNVALLILSLHITPLAAAFHDHDHGHAALLIAASKRKDHKLADQTCGICKYFSVFVKNPCGFLSIIPAYFHQNYVLGFYTRKFPPYILELLVKKTNKGPPALLFH